MADPIVWTIQQSVFAALDAIDGTGDYFTNPTVRYRTQGENAHVSGDLITLWAGGSGERAREGEPDGKHRWRQQFTASCSTDVTADSVDERLHKIRADVEAAIMVDPTRGTIAEDTQPTGAEYIVTEDARVFVQVTFDVIYRTSIGNPTTQS